MHTHIHTQRIPWRAAVEGCVCKFAQVNNECPSPTLLTGSPFFPFCPPTLAGWPGPRERSTNPAAPQSCEHSPFLCPTRKAPPPSERASERVTLLSLGLLIHSRAQPPPPQQEQRPGNKGQNSAPASARSHRGNTQAEADAVRNFISGSHGCSVSSPEVLYWFHKALCNTQGGRQTADRNGAVGHSFLNLNRSKGHPRVTTIQSQHCLSKHSLHCEMPLRYES